MTSSVATNVDGPNRYTRDLGAALGLEISEAEKIDMLVTRCFLLKKNEQLYRAGESFKCVYVIRSGFFKTHYLLPDGREQITGVHMMGDLLGIHAIGGKHYVGFATALEDAEVCEIPFDRLEALSGELPSLQRSLYRLLGEKIVRGQNLMMLLGHLSAEERMAVFLLDLSDRYARRGMPPYRFLLRMSRGDIGNFIGLTIETVSRTLTRLQKNGLIGIASREVILLQPEKLRQLVGATERNG